MSAQLWEFGMPRGLRWTALPPSEEHTEALEHALAEFW